MLHDVAALIYSVISEPSAVDDSGDIRALVLAKYPYLLIRQMLRVSTLEHRLGSSVTGWLDRHRMAPRRALIRGLCRCGTAAVGPTTAQPVPDASCTEAVAAPYFE